MTLGKLNLDESLIKKAREIAFEISEDIGQYIEKHTTVAVERAVLRLFGVDGVDSNDIPFPNIVVDHIVENGGLSMGVATYIGNAVLTTGKSVQEISEEISKNKLNIVHLPLENRGDIIKVLHQMATKSLEKIRANKDKRNHLLNSYGDKKGPLLYVIVATGNIFEDIVQAKAAANQGADVIAVIRTTGQSLLDYVPYGATTEGFGGTYATQENFRIMREALDEEGAKLGRYIRLCNYCSGLCMPEIAAMGALERLDVMLNDALYGILFRDINMQRTLVDQYFSRLLNGFAGVIINTGEDNYLTTADAFEEAHTVLTSQFINEQLAHFAKIPDEQIGLGHAFEIDPDLPDAFLYELAQAQMTREIFPAAPLKYMPPTKHMTGNIFKGHIQDTLFNIVTVLTNQRIHLLGMITEAIHTPFMSDRYLSIENATYIKKTMASLGDELEFKKDGIIQSRSKDVLAKAYNLLCEIKEDGIFKTLELGKFAGVKRGFESGKGLDGVVKKDDNYLNPFLEILSGGVAK